MFAVTSCWHNVSHTKQFVRYHVHSFSFLPKIVKQNLVSLSNWASNTPIKLSGFYCLPAYRKNLHFTSKIKQNFTTFSLSTSDRKRPFFFIYIRLSINSVLYQSLLSFATGIVFCGRVLHNLLCNVVWHSRTICIRARLETRILWMTSLVENSFTRPS